MGLADEEPRLRAAEDRDYPAFARLFPDLGTDDPVPSEERWRARIAPQATVATLGAEVVGYLYAELLDGAGYVRNLVVDPRVRGRGIGRALMGAAAAAMRGAGARTWRLNVAPENLPAVALYRGLGMEIVHASVALTLPWAGVSRLAGPVADAGAHALEVAPITAAEGPRIEARFGLPSGQLAALAAVASVHLRRLRAVDDPDDLSLGFAAFDVDFPGVFPFRVARAGLARPLLAGLRGLARPADAALGVVVEGDEALAAALVAAGASVRLRFVHMVGDL